MLHLLHLGLWPGFNPDDVWRGEKRSGTTFPGESARFSWSAAYGNLENIIKKGLSNATSRGFELSLVRVKHYHNKRIKSLSG